VSRVLGNREGRFTPIVVKYPGAVCRVCAHALPVGSVARYRKRGNVVEWERRKHGARS
jgi:hypothetical protein